MKTEFGEVEEPVPPGTVGSSTMPQKRNPKLCQDIIAAAAEVRAMVPLALEAMMTEHEADRTTSLIMDTAEGRACVAMGDILSRLGEILRGLALDPKRMRANLDLGHGLIMAEAVMLDLGKAIGRQHAHDVVYDAAQAAFVENKSFSDLLMADQRVSSRIDHGRDAQRCWIRHCIPVSAPTMAREQAALARAKAKELARMTEIQRLMVPGQPPPVSHYCHVVRAGNLIWVSGALGVAADGSVPDDVAPQMELALASIDACLTAAGAGAEHVVKVNVYLTDINDRAKINPARQRYFGDHRPASTLVGVTALVLPMRKSRLRQRRSCREPAPRRDETRDTTPWDDRGERPDGRRWRAATKRSARIPKPSPPR